VAKAGVGVSAGVSGVGVSVDGRGVDVKAAAVSVNSAATVFAADVRIAMTSCVGSTGAAGAHALKRNVITNRKMDA